MAIYFRFGMMPLPSHFSVSYEFESIIAINCIFLFAAFVLLCYRWKCMTAVSFSTYRGVFFYSLPHPTFIHPPTKWVLGPLSAAVKRIGHSWSFTDI